MTNRSSDLSSLMPDIEFAELLWENGQIVMQGQSSRAKKSFLPAPFPSSYATAGAQHRETTSAFAPRIGHLGPIDPPAARDLSTSEPTRSFCMAAHDEDCVPWIHCPMDDDPLSSDYCSEFLSEQPDANLNALSSHVCIETDRGSDILEQSLLLKAVEPAQQCRGLIPAAKTKPRDFSIAGSSAIQEDPSAVLSSMRLQKKDASTSKPPHPSTSPNLMNFSIFSRPIVQTKASLQKASAAAAGRIQEQKNASLPLNKDLRPSANAFIEQEMTRKHVNLCMIDGSTASPDQTNRHSSNFAASAPVASSSVHSVNAGAASGDAKGRLKRNTWTEEDSDSHGGDLEVESVELKRPTTIQRPSTKRSRTAEVHNLTERRRRDRINEKLRALQELIPNCNKVDKASMLDEAIEYLKTLQLQAQMLSMGSAQCMPPMMSTPGMHHVRVPAMSGMRMNMGLLGMNGSSGCPLVLAPLRQFGYPMPGCSSLPVFAIPESGVPTSIPGIPPSAASTVKVNSMPEPAANDLPVSNMNLPSTSGEISAQAEKQP